MKKHTFEFVKNYFSDQGCELLEIEYLNNKHPMKYKCKCGDIASIDWNRFKRGQKCVRCGYLKSIAKLRTKFEDVENYFNINNCFLLSKEYKNSHSLLDYRCSCGCESKISFSNFKRGHRCKKCVDLKGDKNPRWNPNRAEVELSFLFRKKCYNMLRASFSALDKKKNAKTTTILGYAPTDLKKHIINHPNWNKLKGQDWHLDHIFPIKAFIDYGIKDLKIINSLKNLRPVSKKVNLCKNDKYNKIKFLKWLKQFALSFTLS